MLIVDSHVHIALHMYEPVEILMADAAHQISALLWGGAQQCRRAGPPWRGG